MGRHDIPHRHEYVGSMKGLRIGMPIASVNLFVWHRTTCKPDIDKKADGTGDGQGVRLNTDVECRRWVDSINAYVCKYIGEKCARTKMLAFLSTSFVI